MKPETITKQIFKIIPALLLVTLSAFLLQGDVWTFWTWYLLAAGTWGSGNAADRKTFSKISRQRMDVFKSWIAVTSQAFLPGFSLR